MEVWKASQRNLRRSCLYGRCNTFLEGGGLQTQTMSQIIFPHTTCLSTLCEKRYSYSQTQLEGTSYVKETPSSINSIWSSGKKSHLLKHLGGLGIKNLAVQNRCLIMKWLWRFNRDIALWKRWSLKNMESSHTGAPKSPEHHLGLALGSTLLNSGKNSTSIINTQLAVVYMLSSGQMDW